AQGLADGFASLPWPVILERVARRVNPLLHDLLASYRYYWITHQAEYATDVLFTSRLALRPLYARLLRHATLCLRAEDVLTFLGRMLHGKFAGEILNDCKRRWPGARVKHAMKANWIKMYDKYGCVLRVETVINDPYEFKVRRRAGRRGHRTLGWHPLPKGVAYLPRYATVSATTNHRHLDALAAVDDPAPAQRVPGGQGRASRPFTPAALAAAPSLPPPSVANPCCRASGPAPPAGASSARPPPTIVGAAPRSPASSNGCISAGSSARFPAR